MNFKQQADIFLNQAQTRKRNPITASTAAKYEDNLAHAFVLFGNRDLADINNSAMKTLVAKLSADGLSASTITGVVNVVKLVVASATDAEGSQLYPRTWNHEFMDLPVIDPKSQDAPVATVKTIQYALQHAKGQDKALYALAAGSGLRVGEMKALRVGPDNSVNSTWDPETGTVYVRTGLSHGIEGDTKTPAGHRQVDLTPELNAFMVSVLHPVTGELVFKSATGTFMNDVTAYAHLKAVGIDGFHSLRRFRITHLRKSAVRESLIKFWTGHANESITDRYDKIAEDIEARKQFAVKAGLGFYLEAQ